MGDAPRAFLRGGYGPALGSLPTTRWTFMCRLYVTGDHPDPDRAQAKQGDLVCRVGDQYFPAAVSDVTPGYVTYRALAFLTTIPMSRGEFGFVDPATLHFTPLTEVYPENFNG